jgi:N-dimethylarginine dimethylaminohydrolase
VLIQKGSADTVDALKQRGLDVFEVETSEFMKSGGSVFCLKQELP